MTAIAYDGPIPPANCIQTRFAQYSMHEDRADDDGLLYKCRGGSAVFWPIWGDGNDAVKIDNYHTDPKLRVIR